MNRTSFLLTLRARAKGENAPNARPGESPWQTLARDGERAWCQQGQTVRSMERLETDGHAISAEEAHRLGLVRLYEERIDVLDRLTGEALASLHAGGRELWERRLPILMLATAGVPELRLIRLFSEVSGGAGIVLLGTMTPESRHAAGMTVVIPDPERLLTRAIAGWRELIHAPVLLEHRAGGVTLTIATGTSQTALQQDDTPAFWRALASAGVFP